MMIIFLVVYALACIFKAKIFLKENEISDYMSRGSTDSIKGIFILLVFFSHFNSYITLNGSLNYVYSYIVSFFGQTMVTLFLFYSGYGVMESIKNKGTDYINSFPKKRILISLINFDIAVFLFLILGLILKREFTISQIFLSFIGWDTLGNSNWYIFVILLLYLFTFVSFKIFCKRSDLLAVGSVLLLTVIYVAVFMVFKIKPYHWFDTALCYPMGMIFSLYKNRIENLMFKKRVNYYICLLTLLAVFLLFVKFYNIPFSGFIKNLVFCMLVVVFTARVKLQNKFLMFCGKHLFELYILQRIPMIVFENIGLKAYPEIYFILSFLFTLILIVPFKFICSKVTGVIAK